MIGQLEIIKSSTVLQMPNSFAGLLVFILLMLIPRPGFPVVALLAERLPVLLVPEQYRITPVRLDVVRNRCRRQFSCPLTLCAKRILYQESLSRLLPLAAIATLKGVRSVANMQFGMLVAVTIIRQSRAAGMLAWDVRSFRHNCLLLSYVRMRERMKYASGQRKRDWGRTQTLYAFLAIISIARSK